MRSTLRPQGINAGKPLANLHQVQDWLPILFGLLVLYVPSFYRFATEVWWRDDQAHGPIIILLSAWLIFRQRAVILDSHVVGRPWLAWCMFIFGMFLYIIGRSQQILSLEIGSLVVVLVALVLIKLGGRALRATWFAFFFMLFMVPLPSAVVSMLTMPMKMLVSIVTEYLLFAAGFPIARSGVILQIGQYQLLVADACAGLQTLLALESLGLFYLNVVRHTSSLRNIGLALLIIPISFTANVMRVLALTLITFYFGDAAGQGFLHGFAGMVLFISALLLIIGVDNFLQWLVRIRNGRVKSKESN